ncbi:hypothetical protein A1OE_1137 [Candidatus Endolissoclinum faulkneri L2]|uniref:Uncharacterized protein n=1 Tax=Candidatus Endolissoclinum faulkneri L2 TaxID=1193729 RepID=K7YI85_9PROT|nr:hypothetical protein A1OE_1137 [Candidatus Endolissoclinum faulkneri L2]
MSSSSLINLFSTSNIKMLLIKIAFYVITSLSKTYKRYYYYDIFFARSDSNKYFINNNNKRLSVLLIASVLDKSLMFKQIICCLVLTIS